MGIFRYFFQKRETQLNSLRVTQEQRQRFNPLRGFDPDKLVSAIDAFRVGEIGTLSRMIEELEERDDKMTISARKNRASLGRCPHQVLIVEGYAGDPRAQRHQEILRRFWANISVTSAFVRNERGSLRLLKQQMAHAISRRFAVHEITWQPLPGGEITATFTLVPTYFFENKTGELRFLPYPGALDGQPMPPGEWLVTVGDGIGIAASVLAMSKRLSFNDWLLFSERCGQPGLHVATGAAEGSAPWDSLVRAVRNFGREWSLVTDNDTKLNPIQLNTGANLPYPPLVEACDKGIVTLYRGADLSTISSGAGEGTGASVQGEETNLLEQDSCELISETLNAQVDAFVIRYVTGDPLPLAYISIAPTERPDVDQDIKIDTHLVSLGVQLSRSDALARYGRSAYDPKNEGDAPLQQQNQPQNPGLWNERQPGGGTAAGTPLQNAGNPLQNGDQGNRGATGGRKEQAAQGAETAIYEAAALEALVEARSAALAPVIDRLLAALAEPDAATLAADLAALYRDLPRLAAAAAADEDSVALLERILGDAVALGATSPESASGSGSGGTTVTSSTSLANAQTRCPVCEQWLNKDGTCTNCRGDPDTGGNNPDSAETQAAEIGKGKRAIETALQNEQDVYGAVSRGDIGTIDLVWGNEKKGLKHIVIQRDAYKARHPEAMGGKEMLHQLPDVLVRGRVVRDGEKMVQIDHGRYRAALVRSDSTVPGARNWVVTAFRREDDYTPKQKGEA